MARRIRPAKEADNGCAEPLTQELYSEDKNDMIIRDKNEMVNRVVMNLRTSELTSPKGKFVDHVTRLSRVKLPL